MLKKEEKFEHILSTYNEVLRFGIQGKSLEKLKYLTEAISWIDGLLKAYKDNNLVPSTTTREKFILDFKVNGYEKKAKTEILDEYSFISMKNSEPKVDRSDFKLFPDLKNILNCISNTYSNKMMSKFKKDKSISVTMMLKLQNIREILKTNKEEDGLFKSRVEKVKSLISKIRELNRAENIGLYDFIGRVENLVKKSKNIVDHPKYPNSVIY